MAKASAQGSLGKTRITIYIDDERPKAAIPYRIYEVRGNRD